MRRRRWLIIALAAVAVLLLAGRALADAFVDYRWFAAMGAADLWRARVSSVVLLRLVSGLAYAGFVFVNLYTVRRSVVSLVLPRRVANLEIGEEVPSGYLLGAVIGLSLLLGALLSLPQDDWSSFALARYGQPFGESDPYFGLDLGFFVYWLPFERGLHIWTLISILIVAAMVLFLYALTPSLRWERGTLYVSQYVRRHLMVLAGVLLLMLAWSYRLDMYLRLVDGGLGSEGTFTRVDHLIGIPGDLVLAMVTLGAALIVVWAGWTGQLRMAGGAIVAVMLLSVIVKHVVPWVAGRNTTNPALEERPYVATRAGYTRRAFAVDRVAAADSASSYPTLADAVRGATVWDAPALVHAEEGTRPVSVVADEIGWMATPAGLAALLPERPVREQGDGSVWRLARVLAWTADEHGALVRVDTAGTPTLDDAQLASPPLVYSRADGWAIVDDPLGKVPGAPLASGAARLAHAWSFQRPDLLGDEPRARRVVVLHRDIRERLRELYPFFVQGTVVTPLVTADSLLWGIDLYSASASYPLSQSELVAGDRRTYFQHAATALVFAATGRVVVVPDSVVDPMATTWLRRFPRLFSAWSALPPDVRAALPPQLDQLRAQAVAFGRWGSRADSDVPKHRPVIDGADSVVTGVELPYVAPGDRAVALALPLVTDQGDRVRGAIVGIGGRARRTLWLALPVDSLRWGSILDRLRGSDSAAPAGQARGAVHALPVGHGLAYVQSTFSWPSTAGASLRRVAALVADSARAAPTLAQLAGTPGARAASPAPSDLRAQVDALYRAMRDAMRRGDWTAFGRAFDALGQLLPSRAP